jgi:hypothetical protein
MFPNAGLIKLMMVQDRMTLRIKMVMLTFRMMVLLRTLSKILRVISPRSSKRFQLRIPSPSASQALLLLIKKKKTIGLQGKLAMTRGVLSGTLLGKMRLL